LNNLDAGLLRFCLEHSDGGALVDNNVPQRDPNDYQWLREALNGLQTDVDRMKKLSAMISNPEGSQADKVASLEELQYLVEDIDNAQDLHKINGFVPVADLLESTSDELRMWAAWVVMTAVQNNPWSQTQALEKGALTKLMELLKTETKDKILAKVIPALSGLIRDHPKAVETFLNENGLRLLGAVVESKDGRASEQTKMKTIFLISYLCRVVPLVKDAVREYGLIQILVELLRSDNNELREKALGCLVEVTKGNNLNIEACKALDTKQIVDDRIKAIKDNADLETEMDLCKLLDEQIGNAPK